MQTIELSGNVLLHAMTVIRDKSTSRKDFIFYANRINNLLCLRALELLEFMPKNILTPTETEFSGVEPSGSICGISIMRAGDAMVNSLTDLCPAIKIGKILIQRDEQTAEAKLFYAKLPKDVAERTCFLLDPMLATGGSAIKVQLQTNN
jgi:uracil phosphoribosyltransferase